MSRKYLKRILLKIAIFLFLLHIVIQLPIFWQTKQSIRKYFKTQKNISLESIESVFGNELEGLPLNFVLQHDSNQLQWNASCANYPKLFRLQFHNKYWQTYENGAVRMHVYGAYFDKRDALPHRPAIRLLALVNQQRNVSIGNYCQIWFEDHSQPAIALVESYQKINPMDGIIPRKQIVPYLMTCLLPEHAKSLIPQAVSLAATPCQNATNILRVICDSLPPKTELADFAICLKGLSYPHADLSSWFIEWLELMRILGAKKVFMSQLKVHPNISKVIEYYEAQKFLESRMTTLAQFANELTHAQQFVLSNFQPNRRLHEIIQYNDCFYRNIYKFKFIAIIDIDEILMPKPPFRNWLDLLKRRRDSVSANCPNGISDFCFRHAHFPLSAPIGIGMPPLQFLRHTQRYKKLSDIASYTKCWHNTSFVVAVHNHFSREYMNSRYCIAALDPNAGQLQHYRYAVKDDQDLGELVVEDNIKRFAKLLIDRTFKVFYDLKFIPDEWTKKNVFDDVANSNI